MHAPMNTDTRSAPKSQAIYRERLSPSLWALLSAAVAAPMVALVFVPLDATVALVTGIAVAVALMAALILLSPVVEVRGGELRVGRAHIPVNQLGEPIAYTGDEARLIRGPALERTAWHMLRGGIDGVIRVPVIDDRDPITEWVFSTRTPERVVAVITRAQTAAAGAAATQA
ncbi:MAG: hypothetical protein ABS62_13310 [Microbacterium sp. SCN 70-200]|nr:DUF3093 domain-containing protein [Microbacterium sp.]ODT39374.1 MAG: hypothetical protein ABS62_13310 [Microbacterium sp. SCN 70-200]OJV83945.1 MAG: hypothetical protein BGO46_13320 [Microbacterium sp. 70-16]